MTIHKKLIAHCLSTPSSSITSSFKTVVQQTKVNESIRRFLELYLAIKSGPSSEISSEDLNAAAKKMTAIIVTEETAEQTGFSFPIALNQIQLEDVNATDEDATCDYFLTFLNPNDQYYSHRALFFSQLGGFATLSESTRKTVCQVATYFKSLEANAENTQNIAAFVTDISNQAQGVDGQCGQELGRSVDSTLLKFRTGYYSSLQRETPSDKFKHTVRMALLNYVEVKVSKTMRRHAGSRENHSNYSLKLKQAFESESVNLLSTKPECLNDFLSYLLNPQNGFEIDRQIITDCFIEYTGEDPLNTLLFDDIFFKDDTSPDLKAMPFKVISHAILTKLLKEMRLTGQSRHAVASRAQAPSSTTFLMELTLAIGNGNLYDISENPLTCTPEQKKELAQTTLACLTNHSKSGFFINKKTRIQYLSLLDMAGDEEKINMYCKDWQTRAKTTPSLISKEECTLLFQVVKDNINLNLMIDLLLKHPTKIAPRLNTEQIEHFSTKFPSKYQKYTEILCLPENTKLLVETAENSPSLIETNTDIRAALFSEQPFNQHTTEVCALLKQLDVSFWPNTETLLSLIEGYPFEQLVADSKKSAVAFSMLELVSCMQDRTPLTETEEDRVKVILDTIKSAAPNSTRVLCTRIDILGKTTHHKPHKGSGSDAAQFRHLAQTQAAVAELSIEVLYFHCRSIDPNKLIGHTIQYLREIFSRLNQSDCLETQAFLGHFIDTKVGRNEALRIAVFKDHEITATTPPHYVKKILANSSAEWKLKNVNLLLTRTDISAFEETIKDLLENKIITPDVTDNNWVAHYVKHPEILLKMITQEDEETKQKERFMTVLLKITQERNLTVSRARSTGVISEKFLLTFMRFFQDTLLTISKQGHPQLFSNDFFKQMKTLSNRNEDIISWQVIEVIFKQSIADQSTPVLTLNYELPALYQAATDIATCINRLAKQNDPSQRNTYTKLVTLFLAGLNKIKNQEIMRLQDIHNRQVVLPAFISRPYMFAIIGLMISLFVTVSTQHPKHLPLPTQLFPSDHIYSIANEEITNRYSDYVSHLIEGLMYLSLSPAMIAWTLDDNDAPFNLAFFNLQQNRAATCLELCAAATALTQLITHFVIATKINTMQDILHSVDFQNTINGFDAQGKADAEQTVKFYDNYESLYIASTILLTLFFFLSAPHLSAHILSHLKRTLSKVGYILKQLLNRARVAPINEIDDIRTLRDTLNQLEETTVDSQRTRPGHTVIQVEAAAA